MYNILEYNEIKELAERQRFKIGELATAVGMSAVGLKQSIEQKSIPAKKLILLCNFLGITPNQFFGIGNGSIASENAYLVDRIQKSVAEIEDLVKQIR